MFDPPRSVGKTWFGPVPSRSLRAVDRSDSHLFDAPRLRFEPKGFVPEQFPLPPNAGKCEADRENPGSLAGPGAFDIPSNQRSAAWEERFATPKF